MPHRASLHLIRVALLDDHALILEGLLACLHRAPSLSVVGSHSNSQGFLALLAAKPVDVALVDYALAVDDIGGHTLVKTLRARYPRIRILVISAHEQPMTVSMLLRAGADGFYGKSQGTEGVVEAIRTVFRGEPTVTTRAAPVIGEPALALSPREWEVIRFLLEGMSVGDIALRCHRSLKTISSQKMAAYKKLGIRHDVDLFNMKLQVQQLDDPS